jgi:hypothetical protein
MRRLLLLEVPTDGHKSWVGMPSLLVVSCERDWHWHRTKGALSILEQAEQCAFYDLS